MDRIAISEPPGLAARIVRVLVVDDHPLTRAGAVSVIQRHDDLAICGEAATSAQAIDLAVRLRPDIILLDLRLDGSIEDGVELAAVLDALVSESRILVYSGYLVQRCIAELLRLGVAGCLPKTVHPEALILAIRTVAAGGQVFASEVTRQVAVRFRNEDGHLSSASKLTQREIEVLQLISEGLPNDQLSRRLSLSPSSVRLCLTSAFAKLGVRNRTDAVVKAHRLGVISID